MKLTKITPYNIHLIAFRLKQFFNRFECLESQTDWGWYPKLLNKMNIPQFDKEKSIEKTMKSYFETSNIIVEVDNSFNGEKQYIRVKYSKYSVELFEIGDWIAISPTMIKKRKSKSSHKVFSAKSEPVGIGYLKPSQNIDEANYQRKENEYWDKQYWEDVEREYEMNYRQLVGI